MSQVNLRSAPFNLTEAQVEEVESTRAGLSLDETISQLIVTGVMGQDPDVVDRTAGLKPGGITRFYGPDRDHDLSLIKRVQADAAVPLLVSADLEVSRMSLPFGTSVPNPLALAAINDLAATKEISRIMAQEAAAAGSTGPPPRSWTSMLRFEVRSWRN